MSEELREILSRYGKMVGFSTCGCAYCFGMRTVEKRITTRQAFHTVMGADLFESLAADMGGHWALFAAIASPSCEKESPAYQALCAISAAELDIAYEPLPATAN